VSTLWCHAVFAASFVSDERTKTVVGIDIQPINEVEASLRHFGARYRHRLFTDYELESCGGGPKMASRLAARFAAKEAVLKILDTRETVPPWRSIEVRRGDRGEPEIVLHDEAAELARLAGMSDLFVSLSDNGVIAVAAVVASVVSQPGGSDQ
jgi:holo-[acyl-carrier protein] synthase